MKSTERKFIQFLLVESKKVIVKIELEVDNSVNKNYPGNNEAEAKQLLDRNKHLKKTLNNDVKRNKKGLLIVLIVDAVNQKI